MDMCQIYKTIIIGRRLFIDDGKGLILIDTGSIESFHQTGIITIAGVQHHVSTSYKGMDAVCMSMILGVDMHGVLAMDIIQQYVMWINTSEFGDFVIFEEYDVTKSQILNSSRLDCLPSIELRVPELGVVRLLIDTSSPITYMKGASCFCESGFINDIYGKSVMQYEVSVDFDMFNGGFLYDSRSIKKLGCVEPDANIRELLERTRCSGIIGYDLIEQFRVCFRYGVFRMPPQGI